MNNDGGVDVNEDNCDLDYGAAGNLISKNHGGKSIFTSRTIYSFSSLVLPRATGNSAEYLSLNSDWNYYDDFQTNERGSRPDLCRSLADNLGSVI